MKELKIKLNRDDFRCLVRGGELSIEVEKIKVKMILDDIGFNLMIDDILDCKVSSQDHFKPLERVEKC